jgi:type VI secretion system protein VasD
VKAAMLSFFASLIAGCGAATAAAGACAAPAQIEVAIESGPLLNPDAEGRALPTEVRLYRVRDAAVFETVGFDSVWQSDTEALGDAMLGVDSLTLYPGETTNGSIAPEPDARAIVAMAIVRQPAGRTWRTAIDVGDLPCGTVAQVRLRLDEFRIERTSLGSEEGPE